MPSKNIITQALLHALGVFAYIFLVVNVLEKVLMKYLGDLGPSILQPIIFLTIFVLSAAITGSLVVLRPAMWYHDGQKKAALQLLFTTIAWLLVILVAFICFAIGF